MHRTLIQTAHDPSPATAALARLLAQLDLVTAASLITTSREDPTTTAPDSDRAAHAPGLNEVITGSDQVRFRFTPFPSPPLGHHTGAEYL